MARKASSRSKKSTESATTSKTSTKKARKSRKTKSKTVAEPTPATTPAPEPVVEKKVETTPEVVESTSAPTANSTTVNVEDRSTALFDTLISTLQARITADRALLSDLRTLRKTVASERRQYSKVLNKYNKRRTGNRRNGFQVPTPISAQMAKFVGVPSGSEMARTDVTKFIHSYIKEKNLQNPENGQEIFPDSKLKKLLYSGDDSVTYFKLQTYLKPHFLRKDKETGEVAPFVAPTSS